MIDERMQIFVGGAMVISGLPEEYSDAVHGRAGIGAADWEILRSPTMWTPDQARRAGGSLDKVLSFSLTASGLPAFQLPAEYVAACIVVVCHPSNWLAAAEVARAGLNGAMLVSPDGDQESQRELVTSRRLAALVLKYYTCAKNYRIGAAADMVSEETVKK